MSVRCLRSQLALITPLGLTVSYEVCLGLWVTTGMLSKSAVRTSVIHVDIVEWSSASPCKPINGNGGRRRRSAGKAALYSSSMVSMTLLKIDKFKLENSFRETWAIKNTLQTKSLGYDADEAKQAIEKSAASRTLSFNRLA
jgi:hypothetical protein